MVINNYSNIGGINKGIIETIFNNSHLRIFYGDTILHEVTLISNNGTYLELIFEIGDEHRMEDMLTPTKQVKKYIRNQKLKSLDLDE